MTHRQDEPVTGWDAPSAVRAAVRAAGPRRHVFLADFALRLARLGHIRDIRVDVAGGTEAFEAVRSVLAELAPVAEPEADARLGTYAGAGDEQADLDQTGRAHAANASRKRTGPLAKRTGTCLACGTVFTVNFRHAEKHRFCSAVCRSRHRRRSLLTGAVLPK
jgi:hypothetical protein